MFIIKLEEILIRRINEDTSEKIKNVIFIVLGKNWQSKDPLVLSADSKISVLALICLLQEAIKQGHNISVIFCTGHTAGAENMSEAEAMKKFFEEKCEEEEYKLVDLTNVTILLEEDSLDTLGNAKEVKKSFFSQIDDADKIILITVSYHMKRSKDIFESILGRKICPVNADELVEDPELRIPIEDRLFICHRKETFDFVCIEPIKEFILRSIRVFDRQGKFIYWLVKKIRS